MRQLEIMIPMDQTVSKHTIGLPGGAKLYIDQIQGHVYGRIYVTEDRFEGAQLASIYPSAPGWGSWVFHVRFQNGKKQTYKIKLIQGDQLSVKECRLCS